MYKDETLYLEMKAQQMALPSIEQQVRQSPSEIDVYPLTCRPPSPTNLAMWTHGPTRT